MPDDPSLAVEPRDVRDEVARKVRVIAWLATWVLRALRRSVRLRFHDAGEIRGFESNDRRFILTAWHRHMLLLRWAYRGRRVTVLASLSKDGEIMTQVLRRLGVEPCRGSTS